MPLWLLGGGLLAAGNVLAQGGLAAGEARPGAVTTLEAATPSVKATVEEAIRCERISQSPWPANPSQRALYLDHLERLRPRCMESAAFLAVLGGVLLEEGNAEQALVWLERSLLLDASNLGAQADHALALAALGEGRALQQLTAAWAGRGDLPPALRDRLFPDEALRAVRLGRTGLPVWGLQGELSVFGGYESNLDQSPRLTQLTLTAPGGEVDLPVTSQPRRGAAWLSSASVQAAYSPSPAFIWRTGLSGSARGAPSHSQTDWQFAQWTASGVQRWSWWRTRQDLALTWVGGSLSEPYRLLRAGVGAELAVRLCRVRMGLEAEQRQQQQTHSFDSLTTAATVGLDCTQSWWPGATVAAYMRTGRDEPDSIQRPGGRQRQLAGGLRVAGPLGPRWQAELGWRVSAVHDAEGYSPLLKDNEARRVARHELSLELGYRPLSPWLAGAQPVLQVQWARQASNLALFEHRSASVYGGLRWGW